jgi:hypothetical protein
MWQYNVTRNKLLRKPSIVRPATGIVKVTKHDIEYLLRNFPKK